MKDKINWYFGTRVRRKTQIINWSFDILKANGNYLQKLKEIKYILLTENIINAFNLFRIIIIDDIVDQAKRTGARHFTSGDSPDIWVYLISENIDRYGKKVEMSLFNGLMKRVSAIKPKRRRKTYKKIIYTRTSSKGLKYKQVIYRDIKTGRFIKRPK